MKARRIKLLVLALAGVLAAPSAMAHRGHHDHNRIGVVIHLGALSSGIIQKAKPYKPHNHSYRHGYRDGYQAGVRTPKKGPRHKHKHKHKTQRHRPGHVHVLPPGHYRPAPGHKVHFHR